MTLVSGQMEKQNLYVLVRYFVFNKHALYFESNFDDVITTTLFLEKMRRKLSIRHYFLSDARSKFYKSVIY